MPKTGLNLEERKIFVDNTALDAFRKCPRKAQLRIQQGLNQVIMGEEGEELGVAPALLFGSAIHAALDVIYIEDDLDKAIRIFLEHFQPVPADRRRTPTRGSRILEQYYDHWHNFLNTIEGVLPELTFRVELGTLRTREGEPWTVVYTGIIDKIIKLQGEWFIMDHKTSTNVIQAMLET